MISGYPNDYRRQADSARPGQPGEATSDCAAPYSTGSDNVAQLSQRTVRVDS
jgi:hypothetical protein